MTAFAIAPGQLAALIDIVCNVGVGLMGHAMYVRADVATVPAVLSAPSCACMAVVSVSVPGVM